MFEKKFWIVFSLVYLFLINDANGHYIGSAYNRHYEEHDKSVQTARSSIGLNSLSGQLNTDSVVDCSLCTSNLHTGVGHGLVNFNKNSGLASSSSSSSSSSKQISQGFNNRNILIPVNNDLDYQYESGSLSSSQNLHASNTPYISSGGKSEIYENQRIIKSDSTPTFTYIPSSSSRGSESHQYYKKVDVNSVPIVYQPSVSSSSIHQESQKVIKSDSTPTFTYIPSSSSGGSESHQYYKKVDVNSVPIVYQPSLSSSSIHQESQKVIKSDSTPTFTYIPSSSNGGSESHQYYKNVNVNTSPVIIEPSVSSSSSIHQESQKVIKSDSAPSFTYIPSSSSGGSESHQYYKNVDVNSVPIVYQPSVSSSSIHEKNQKVIQSQLPTATHITSYPTYYPSEKIITTYPELISKDKLYQSGFSSDSYSSRNHFNSGLSSSSLLSGEFHHGSSSSLNNLMNESERLAKLQSESIREGSSRTGGITIDSHFDGSNFNSELEKSAGLALDASTRTGGFRKTQSWEKSSKWASGSEYGPDGNPKSYNLLSTAESEDHNINGKKLGYKAATTTLDNNGKVSTYSIHT